MTWTPEQMQRVAAAVKARRGNLSQDTVIARAGEGLSRPVLSQIENAKQPRYKQRTILALCQGLGWTAEEFAAILNGEVVIQPVGVDVQLVALQELVASHEQLIGEQADQLASLTRRLEDLRADVERWRDQGPQAGDGSP